MGFGVGGLRRFVEGFYTGIVGFRLRGLRLWVYDLGAHDILRGLWVWSLRSLRYFGGLGFLH